MSRKFFRKTIAVFLLTLMTAALALCLCGCGKGSSGADCRDILDACRKIAPEGSFDTLVCYGEELYDESFDSLYGIQFKDISDGAILYSEEGGRADEISIVCMKKNEDVSVAKQKFQDRIENRRNAFQGYKPEEVYKLDNASVIVQGNYVALIISENNDDFETEIRRVISEDA